VLKLGEQYRVSESGFVGVAVKVGIMQAEDPNPRVILEQEDGTTWEGPESRLEPIHGVAGPAEDHS